MGASHLGPLHGKKHPSHHRCGFNKFTTGNRHTLPRPPGPLCLHKHTCTRDKSLLQAAAANRMHQHWHTAQTPTTTNPTYNPYPHPLLHYFGPQKPSTPSYNLFHYDGMSPFKLFLSFPIHHPKEPTHQAIKPCQAHPKAHTAMQACPVLSLCWRMATIKRACRLRYHVPTCTVRQPKLRSSQYQIRYRDHCRDVVGASLHTDNAFHFSNNTVLMWHT
jgi:hypothetical protein